MEQNNEVIDLSYENKFSSLLSKYSNLKPPEIKKPKLAMGYNKPKRKYEFIELCKELEPIYGKTVWQLPRRIGFTEYKIRKAHEIATQQGKQNIGYLIGCIRKMPY